MLNTAAVIGSLYLPQTLGVKAKKPFTKTLIIDSVKNQKSAESSEDKM